MGNGLADERVALRHCAAILGFDLGQVNERNSLGTHTDQFTGEETMVGSWGLEPQTSTVSKRRDYVPLINNLEGVGDCLSALNYG